MQNAVKPRKSLAGYLLFTPAMGMPATIIEADGVIKTSPVCSLNRGPNNTIIVETKNSIYVLAEK